MKTSENGLNLIKRFEGCKLVPYFCPAGVLTVGFGHTGADVFPEKAITQAEADALLVKDVARFEDAVKKAVVVPLNQNQFDALVSFTYNLGSGNLNKSTLLIKVNSKDFAGAALEFLKWNKGGGLVLPGLTVRRTAEKELFERA